MTLRAFFGKIRRKLLRAALGRELFERLYAPVEERLAETRDTLSRELAGLRSGLEDSIKKRTDDTLSAVNRRADEIQKRMDNTLDAVNRRSDEIKKKADAVQTAVNAALNKRMDTLREVLDRRADAISGSIGKQALRLYQTLLRTTPKAALTTVVISLAEHCNLRCVGCDHFAPIAEETFMDPGAFERDMRRLAYLAGDTVGTIKLMGGEPLLHPDKETFFAIAREQFPRSRIEVVTNGILLAAQNDGFWAACRERRITIVPTKYPLNIDWDAIIERARAESVGFNFYSDTELKTSYHIPFDITGTRDSAEMFINCFHANNCRELLNGRLYTCTVRPHAVHFNKAFGTDMLLSDDDSIDIHAARDMREVLEFLAKPIPFCRYCNVLGRTFGHPWGRSNKEQSEWT